MSTDGGYIAVVEESHRALPHIKMRVSQECIRTHNLANSSESNTEARKLRPLQMARCSIDSPAQLYHAGDDDWLHEALHRWTLACALSLRGVAMQEKHKVRSPRKQPNDAG